MTVLLHIQSYMVFSPYYESANNVQEFQRAVNLNEVTMLIGPLDEARCMLQKMKDLHKSPGKLADRL